MTHGLVVGRWFFYFDEFYLADPLCVGLQWNNSRLLEVLHSNSSGAFSSCMAGLFHSEHQHFDVYESSFG